MIDWYVGQEVYLEPIENMKAFVGSSLVRGVVEKVGRKYVHVRPIGFSSTYKFRRENGAGVGECDMSPQWRLYWSKKDYEDVVEAREIAGRLHEIFAWRSFAANNIPLENLRQILKLAEATCPKN